MRVSSPTSHLAIAPGDRREIPIDVINTLSVIDGVTARVVGLPEKNVTARPSMLPLFPDASGQITLAIELPQTFPAGTHPLTIEVASRQPETPPEYVNVDLSVPIAPAIELVSRPEVVRARRTGRFIVTVTNRGNTLLDVDVAVTDPQKICSVTVQPAALQLPAGESAEAVVTVRGRRMWMGVDNDRALIAEATGRAVSDAMPGIGMIPVAAPDTTGIPAPRPPGAGDALPSEVAPKTVETHATITFRQRPYLTRGLLTALILFAIIALWAAAFLFGLSKVFSSDPLTKSAPASFFAATPPAAGATNGTGAGTGTAGGGANGAGAGAGTGSGTGGANEGATDGGSGTAANAAPAGSLPKTGTLPPGVGGAISGTVTAASSGEPVGRILVTALRVKADGTAVAVASAATQSDGTYQVAGLFPGPYYLKFEAPGFRTTYFPAATDTAGAKKLNASTGGVTPGGDAVVIGLPATITGKVDFGDITEPITATVSARLLGAASDAGAQNAVTIPDVSTTADGTYTLRNLPAPGTYQLTFTAPGYEISTVQSRVTGGANRFVSAAVLSAGNVQITGTVTDGVNPLGGATVSLSVGGQQISTGTPTVGQVGHFVIDNLPTPATYILTVSKDGYGKVSQVIDLGPSGQQGELTVALTAGTGVVTGTVTGIGGAGVGGATVVAGGLADPPQTTTVTDGAIGTFQLAGLPVPGSYTLTVTAPGYAEQTVPVVLAADAVLPPLNITLVPSSGVITGRVLDAKGAGIPRASVSVTDGQKAWPVVTTSASAGSSAGSFTVADLPAGQYTVTATAVDTSGNAQSRTTLVNVVPGSPVTLLFTMTGGG